MRKRILASLMALILALSLLPTAALATGETQEPEQEAQIPVSEDGTEGGGEDATIPVETGDETDTSDGTETPVVTTPTVTPTETTPVETLTPVVQEIGASDVAAIGDVGYETLADAITAVTTGQTIVLQGPIDGCEKVTINRPGVSFTIDFKNQSLNSVSNTWAIEVQAGTVTLRDGTVQGAYGGISCSAGANVTLQNMHVTKTQTTGRKDDLSAIENSGTMVIKSGAYNTVAGTFAPTILNLAEMTIEGGTFETGATDSGWSVMICRGGANTSTNTVITGGSFVNEVGYGITCSNGANVEFGGTAYVRAQSPALGGNNTTAQENFTVTGGTLVSEESAAIFFPAEGKLEISDGTITGLTGIHALMGDIEISGGTITGTATKSDIEEGYPGSGSGPRSNGSALLLVSNWYKESATGDLGLRVNITDGTFTSAKGAEAIDHMMPNPPETNAEFTCTVRGGTFYNAAPDEKYIASGYEATQTTAGWEVAAKQGMEADVSAENGASTGTVTGSFSTTQKPTGGEAGEGSVEAGSGSVTINVQTGENENGETVANDKVSSTTVTVDKASVSSVAEKKVNVTLQTDVADLEIPSEAWKSMANAAKNDSIVIAVKENKDTTATTTWDVTAQDESGSNVFDADSQGEIKITVAYTAGADATDVKVYCIDTGEWMETIWDKTNALLSWFAPHFSSYGTVETKAGDVATWTVKGGTTGTGSLAQALEAVRTNGGEINLLQDATLPNAQYVISKDVTINGNGKQVTVDVKDGAVVGEGPDTMDGNIAFNVGNGATFTLNNVKMTIDGTKNGNTAKGNDGTGFNVSQGGVLEVNDSTITVQNIERATTAGGADQAHFQFDNSQVTFQNIDGNASNGGDWTLDNTDLTINGCGSHAISAHTFTTTGSTNVNISNTGYAAIYGYNKINIGTGTNVTVTNCGTNLPYRSEGNYGDCTAPIQMQVKRANKDDEGQGTLANSGAKIEIDQGATVTVTGTKNTVHVPSGVDLINDGTVNATVEVAAPVTGTNKCVVQYVVNGQTVYVHAQNVQDGVTDGWNSPNPTLPNMIFTGWICTSHPNVSEMAESDGNKKWNGVEAGKTYTFTAQFSQIVTPVVPDDNTPSYSGGSSSSETSYSNTIDASDGGSVKVSPRTPSRGETVTITPTPDTGYEVDEVIVTDRNGDEVEVTANRNGTYTFEQPRGRVTIEVTFVRTGGTAGAAPFLDVAEDAWYADAVAYVYDNGLMSGTSTTLFSPNATTTRGMIVTMLYRLEGEPRISSGSAFDDVDAGMYYADAVAWASQNDIVTGYDEATFGPNNAITREQMAAILYRYAQYKGYRTTAGADLSGYVDADSVSSYALASLQWANAAGLVTGTSSNTLTPDGSATRAQVATIFMRFMEDVAE